MKQNLIKKKGNKFKPSEDNKKSVSFKKNTKISPAKDHNKSIPSSKLELDGNSKRVKRHFKKNSSTNFNHKIKNDPRFSHIPFDHRYKDPPKQDLKIKLDDRFKSVLNNKGFLNKDIPDSRGRPRNFRTQQTLDKFYELGSDVDDDEEDESEPEVDAESTDSELEGSHHSEDSIIESGDSEEDSEENTDVSSDEEEKGIKRERTEEEEKEREEHFRECLKDPEKDVARGDLFYSEDSSDDDSSTTDSEGGGCFGEFDWGEMDKDAQWDGHGVEVQETRRFAVCDMDWDRVRAVDLMVLFSSFAPPPGKVERVAIYPSEYGKKHIDEEEKYGPQELVRLAAAVTKRQSDELDDLNKIKKGTYSDSSKPSDLHIEALRRYQRNRLKYYYAVVVCDCVETARSIYVECDRSHFDVIGVTMDLRYVPDDMDFEDVPHDECCKVPANYVSEKAPTMPLQEAKPSLTWDETDHRRKATISSIMAKASRREKIDEDALKAYVGDSEDSDDVDISGMESESGHESEDDDGGDEKQKSIAKFRSLISEIDRKEKKKHDSFWRLSDESESENPERGQSSPEESDKEKDPDSNDPEDTESSKDKGELVDSSSLTPFEKYLTKRKLKKKNRKKAMNNLEPSKMNHSDDEGSDAEFSQEASREVSLSKDSKNKSKKRSKAKKSSKNIITETEDERKNKGQLSLLLMDEEAEDKRHFNLRKLKGEMSRKQKTKKRKGDEPSKLESNPATEDIENFEVDWNDPRFSAVFTSGKFHVDPSHPKYNPTVSKVPANAPAPAKRSKMDTNSTRQQVSSNASAEDSISNLVHKIRMKTSKK